MTAPTAALLKPDALEGRIVAANGGFAAACAAAGASADGDYVSGRRVELR